MLPEEEENEKSVSLDSAIESMETMLNKVAPMFVQYYKKLTEDDLPADLAFELTKELHEAYWTMLIIHMKKSMS